MSPSACLARVRRLEQNGVIKRYLTDIDLTSALPWTELWCEITLLPVPADRRAEFEERIGTVREIVRAYQIVGHIDYALEIAAPDASAWPAIVRKLDPDADTIAKANAQIKVRTVKHFSGSPQLAAQA